MAEHKVILYYKYLNIAEPKKLMNEQKELCSSLSLKGRVLIAHEGINGTLEGTNEAIEQYCELMSRDARFSDMQFKISDGTGKAFKKLSIKVRREIVTSSLGEQDVDPTKVTGKYLMPEELHSWIAEGREFYIIDMRNDYEHEVGRFENSLLPPMGHFRDLKTILPQIEKLKDKTILTVCTGGVRCEKASGFLVKHGFTDVYQLWGGIVTYMEKYPNEHFKGKLYVFDGRVTMGFNVTDPKHEIVGKCKHCGITSENFVNCADDDCHKHFICCEQCFAKLAYCNLECEKTWTQKLQQKIKQAV